MQEKLAAVRAQAEASARGTAAPRSPLQQQQQQAQQQQKQPQQPQQAGAAAAAAAAAAQLGPGAAYPKAAQQAAESQRRLLRLRHRTTQEVSSVRGAADEAEAAHRAAEEQLRQVRRLLGLEWVLVLPAAAGPCCHAHATIDAWRGRTPLRH